MTDSLDLAAQVYADGSLSISGSRRSLEALGQALATDVDVVIALPRIAPAPPRYVAAARAIRVHIETDPGLTLGSVGDEFVLAGHPASLAIFASNISNFGSNAIQGNGNHLHEEHYEGHYYWRPDSTPLIVEAT